MFLAAAPYFHSRFAESEWLVAHFQSGIMAVSTVTTLFCTWLLTKMQTSANYPKRIVIALVINVVCFTALAVSTSFTAVQAETYFAFLMLMVLCSSIATSFCQNGVFAFVSGFGVGDYTQGIMAGQGIAGVLPCVVQIAAVLAVPEVNADGPPEPSVDPRSAFAYFLTATAVSTLTLFAFLYLAIKNPRTNAIRDVAAETADDVDGAGLPARKSIGMWTLFKKLKWFASGVTITFCVTMMFPVFTAKIYSVRDPATAPPIFRPAAFIPLGFFVWNLGDFVGRLLPLWPRINGTDSPRLVLSASVARVLFVPLYLACNINDRGALIPSDAFYLGVVQLFFGMTNGYLGSTCMMAAPAWVDENEREAAGGFMGLMLVLGLSIGSLLSFLVGTT